MGQYFRAVVLKNNGVEKVFDNKIIYKEKVTENGVTKLVEKQAYCGVKLMEHAYFDDMYVEAICKAIHHTPSKVAWVGDYCGNFMKVNTLDRYDLKRLSNLAHGSSYYVPTYYDEFSSKDKFLVNHTHNVYIDLQDYCKSNKVEGSNFIIHPLPLLTACGNGDSGSDYMGCNYGDCGEWAYDVISIEDEAPSFYTQVYQKFKE